MSEPYSLKPYSDGTLGVVFFNIVSAAWGFFIVH